MIEELREENRSLVADLMRLRANVEIYEFTLADQRGTIGAQRMAIDRLTYEVAAALSEPSDAL